MALANYSLDAGFVSALPANAIGGAAIHEIRALGAATRHIVRSGERVGIYYLETGASQRPPKVVYDRAGPSIATAKAGGFDWQKIVDDLARNNYLVGMDDDEFLDRAAYHFGEINFLHPFRDGNGRTPRQYMDKLAARSGRGFQWDRIDKETMIAAVTHAKITDHSLVRDMLKSAQLQTPYEPAERQRRDPIKPDLANANQNQRHQT